MLLLVHGITGTRHEVGYFDLVAQELQGCGVATLPIDYRGHGESAVPISALMLSGVMLDIEAAWNYATSEYQESIVRLISGASFGAGVSCLFAESSPTVDATLLSMPVLSYVDDLSRANPAWRQDLPQGFIGYQGNRLDALLLPELYFFDKLINDTPLSKPLTILHGIADSDVPFQASLDFAAARAGVVVVGLEDMDHGWTVPGDLARKTERSWENQRVAGSKTVELVCNLIAASS